MRSTSPLALLLAAAGIVAAAEEPPGPATDLRLVYGLGPDRYSIASPAFDEDGRWDRSQQVRLDLLHRRAPLGLGVSFAGQRSDEHRGGSELEYGALSGRVNVGMAVEPAAGLQLEVLPFAGWGLSGFERSGAPADGLSGGRDRDDFFEYGLNVNAVVTTGSLQFGAGVGYLVTESTYVLEPAARATLDQEGPVYGIFIGTRR